MITGLINLMMVVSLMNIVATVQPYDYDDYNCHHHSVLLTNLLRQNNIEAYYHAGYVGWYKHSDREVLDCLNQSDKLAPFPGNVSCIYGCCHAWVDVVLFGRNWTIESTTGRFVNSSIYMPLNFQDKWISDSENFRIEADSVHQIILHHKMELAMSLVSSLWRWENERKG